MNSIATDMATFPTLFPPGSDQAPKTEASPDIFTHMDDFKALAAKLAADAKTAADSAAIGLDAFTTAYNTVGQDCTACHNKYPHRIAATATPPAPQECAPTSGCPRGNW